MDSREREDAAGGPDDKGPVESDAGNATGTEPSVADPEGAEKPQEAALAPPIPPAPKRPKRILVAYNHTEFSVLAEAPEPSAEAVRELTALLSAQGFDVLAINAEDDCDRLGDAVVVYRPDLILNLIDHFHGDTLLAGPSASLLDIYEYPYTGGDAHCITACQDRLRCRLMLTSAGVRVPGFAPMWTRRHVPDLRDLRYPVILTQAFDDIYHRSDERPLLEDEAAVRAFTDEILTEYDPPLLIEEYIGDQKMSVIVVAGKYALTACEVWRDEDEEWHVTVAELTGEQTAHVHGVAIEASEVMGCRDWSQVEVTLDEAGIVFVTDVRPIVTPWNPDNPFRVAAADHFEGAGGVLAEVVKSALARAEKVARIQAAQLVELAELAEDS